MPVLTVKNRRVQFVFTKAGKTVTYAAPEYDVSVTGPERDKAMLYDEFRKRLFEVVK